MKARILLVEDDLNLGTVLKEFLRVKGYVVTHSTNGEEALKIFEKEVLELIVLDIMMPKLDGFSTAKVIRKKDENIPIIFLSAKSMTEDRIEGLKLGADDYITKPFSTEELLLRIEAVLKRAGSFRQNKQTEYKIGNFVFDYSKRLLKSDEETLKLTSREADLLNMLCYNVNDTLLRKDALKNIWGDDNYFTARSMDVYITKLRGFLKKDKRVEIINVHGTGYKLISP